MQIHQLQRNTPNKKSRQVGRGGKRGYTSGRGSKGQKARAGRKLRPEMRDVIKKIPKRRGYGKNRSHTVNPERAHVRGVNLSVLENHFNDGDTITRGAIIASGIVRARGGKLPALKILGAGDVTKKFTVMGVPISLTARTKIEKVGGSVK